MSPVTIISAKCTNSYGESETFIALTRAGLEKKVCEYLKGLEMGSFDDEMEKDVIKLEKLIEDGKYYEAVQMFYYVETKEFGPMADYYDQFLEIEEHTLTE